ncbi:hypothetical protein [Acidocella facilis]|uniref:hypothetical protein n=1 Tax=Acidocella facilis TaxID=525 RepID=UPI00047B79C4|nr:hypothetical protein [Acidocella facilis]
MTRLLALLAALALTAPADAAPCPVTPLQNHGADLVFGAFKAHMVSDSDPGNSAAWEGPLIISAGGKSCEADISIITPPFFLAGAHDLYVTTYSGSESTQYLVDARNCHVLWASPLFTGNPALRGGDVFIYPDAKPVRIQPDCRPADP